MLLIMNPINSAYKHCKSSYFTYVTYMPNVVK